MGPCPYKKRKGLQTSLPAQVQRKGFVGTQREGSRLQTRKRALPRNQSRQRLDRGLQNCEKRNVCGLSLWDSVVVTQAR